MIKCAIIDDEQPAIDVIQFYIDRMCRLQLADLELTGTATNPLTGLDMIKEQKPDVVFLDIQMDEMSGLEVMRIISPETKVVFCTAFSEFAVQSYDLEAVDYLMKPVEFERFVKAVQRVAVSLSAPLMPIHNIVAKDYVFVKTENKGRMIKIDFNDIDYIEGLRNYVTFYLANRKIIAHYTMKEVEDLLPADQFMRVHRSYIVAVKKISEIRGGELILKTTPVRIPVSNHYREDFLIKTGNK